MRPENAISGFETPLGWIRLEASEIAIVSLSFVPRALKIKTAPTSLLKEARRQLENYFSGNLQKFSIPVDPSGTEFQKSLWAQLLRIPFGSVKTYGALAAVMKKSGAARAIGGACGANPIPIIIPCHRVTGAGGKLTGFSAGLWRKEWLLKHEGKC